jgi:hypothetical protein
LYLLPDTPTRAKGYRFNPLRGFALGTGFLLEETHIFIAAGIPDFSSKFDPQLASPPVSGRIFPFGRFGWGGKAG